jgi:hypothetical protein
MRRIAAAILLAALAGMAQEVSARAPQPDAQLSSQDASTNQKSTITLPVGTRVALVVTSPVWTKSAMPGDRIYSMTSFPLVAGNEIAVPQGTYVEGKIDTLTRPHWLSGHADFQLHFTKLIFANGYTVDLSRAASAAYSLQTDARVNEPAVQAEANEGGAAVAASGDVATAIALVHVQVSPQSDILLDNGSPIEMILQTPLSLEAGRVAAAARASRPMQMSGYKSATRCVPTSGTPGTPDTVIPGTPGIPGTPDTVIPGGPGMPDTVIPGTPATPGTPPTVIPGSPGFPGRACPGPPIVMSSSAASDAHRKAFQLASSLQIGPVPLPAGKYQARWTGLGPMAEVDILQNKKLVVRALARVVILERKSAKDESLPRPNADGSVKLGSLQFTGESFELIFE